VKKKDEDQSINFGGLFKGLDKIIDLMVDMVENQKEEINVDGEFSKPEKNNNIIGKYGFSIKLGGENIPHIQKENELNKILAAKRIEPRVIEPAVEVFDEGDRIIIVIEVQGVKEEEIDIVLDEKIITIHVAGAERNYTKKIDLDFTPRKEDITAKLNHSIYSVIVTKH